jgi:hypothetical protein
MSTQPDVTHKLEERSTAGVHVLLHFTFLDLDFLSLSIGDGVKCMNQS